MVNTKYLAIVYGSHFEFFFGGNIQCVNGLALTCEYSPMALSGGLVSLLVKFFFLLIYRILISVFITFVIIMVLE